ncbi:MAG: hypothetical protein ACYTGX_15580 [Planctomycetota bacterium]|jgi:hypothetical protein
MPLDPISTTDYGYGEQIAAPVSRPDYLPMPLRQRQPPFDFCYVPRSWVWDDADGGEWLPRLVRIPHKAGVNGVRQYVERRAGPNNKVEKVFRLDVEPARSAFRQKKHAIVLDNFDAALVPKGNHSYVTKHQTRDGGLHFDAYWVRYEALGSQIDKVEDTAERRAFQRRIIKRHMIKMPLLVLKQKVKAIDAKLARWGEDEKGNADVLARKIREGLARRDRMVAAWANAFNDGAAPQITVPPAVAVMRLDQDEEAS